MPEADDDGALEAQVLGIVRAVVRELHPHRGQTPITLDSSLDRDLGLDSLARSELLLRISEATRIELPDELLGTAERPRDLIKGLRASPITRRSAPDVPAQTGASAPVTVEVPHDARTLVDVLISHATASPDRIHVNLYEGSSDTPRAIRYDELFVNARRVAAGLRRAGLEPGQVAAIMLPTCAAYLETFLGVLLAGGIALPIYPPERPSQLEDHLKRHGQILDNAQAKLLVAPAEAHPVVRLLRNQALSLQESLTPDELMAGDGAPFVAMPISADDMAMLQYTSGSTGQPKGVILTHGQLLANIRAMGTAIAATPDDVFLSWLPLYHDMGLIGAWLGSLYFAMQLVLMPPTAFLGRPSRWLTRLHAHRATISGAPNFAYEVCVSRVRDEQITGIDLSNWRLAFNGAEPVSPNTVRRFTERFAKYGFRPQAMAPAYGLAEAGVCLTVPPLERGPLFERVERDAYQRRGEALAARHDDASALEFISSGQALPGYQLRIADDAGRELPDRREGRVEFRGPSATRGYMRNPEATRRLFHGNWLDTGDLGYVVGGDLFITSRVKDLIKRAGRNIYPYEVEEVVGNLPGIRKGCVAAFGSSDAFARTEKLVVVAETIETASDALAALHEQIDHAVSGVLGFAPDDVALVRPESVLKTSSGKIRRAACRELYESGDLGRPAKAVPWQLVRLWWSGVRGRRIRRGLSDQLYALWARSVFGVLAVVAWSAVVLIPSKQLRWRATRGAARLLFRLTAIPFTVRGLEHLPMRPCVFVSNHASYLDGVALMAALPTTLSFVVKAELAQRLLTRVFLERIGASFVERFDAEKGVEDAQRITRLLKTGESVLFFPEGTLTRMPGLLPFHMGAFAAAAEAGVPTVPVAVRGTRSILRSDIWFAHRGSVSVEFAAPVASEGSDWHATVELRDRVREVILARLGEPDLAHVVAPLTSPGQG
jgi:1-acyl-sn-glycerol-3-phosphate acyltransferase